MIAEPHLHIRRADLDGRLVDVTVGNIGGSATIIAIDPHRAGSGRRGDEFDARGGAIIPGLHDHHIHLLALAAARTSVDISGLDAGEALQAIGHRARAGRDEWMRVVGLHDRHEAVHPWDADVLDSVAPGARIRVQHRSGAMWVLSHTAMAELGLLGGPIAAAEGARGEIDDRGAPTGRWYGLDAFIRRRAPQQSLDLTSLGRELASYGVTGVTDATPTDRRKDFALLSEAARRPGFPIVQVTGAVSVTEHPAPLRVGPVKLLPADHSEFDLASITRDIDRAHRVGRAVAIHCVSRIGLVVALAAWEDAGVMAGDRVEHGGIIDPDSLERIAQLQLTVVTQPNFIAERGDDYQRDVDADDQPYLYRCGTLIDRGIAVAGSTDAPFGHPDPWRAIAAATDRRTASGAIVGDNERITARQALEMFLSPLDAPSGPPRVLEVGAPADLCVLATPITHALTAPREVQIAATIRAGDLSAWGDSAARH
ncbi:MAG: amidohydrolase family protein [Acidimicrobiia bacterium]